MNTNTDSDAVYKIVLYMTPAQWEEMLSMNASQGKPSWIGLKHEGIQNEQFKKHVKEMQAQYSDDSDDSDTDEDEKEEEEMECIEKLDQFDPQTMITHNCLIIGKRNVGKTTLIKKLINHTKITQGGVVVGNYQNEYDDVSNVDFHQEYNSEIVDKLIKSQREKLVERNQAPEEMRSNDIRKFILFDDCFHGNITEHMKEKCLRGLVMNNRQYLLTLIHSQSFALQLPPTYRINIDAVFIFRDSNVANRKRIYDLYGGHFKNYQMFDRYMTEYTKEPYQCMVIYNNARTSQIKDCVFWYTA